MIPPVFPAEVLNGLPDSAKMRNDHGVFHKRFLRPMAVGVLALLITGSAYAGNAEQSYVPSAGHKAAWGYEGEGAPDKWGELKPEFKMCGLGKFQSPVNIVPTLSADLPDLEFDYKDSPLEILNNGHTVQVNFPEGSSLKVGGDSYHLLQLHFHTPSENAVNGRYYPMEMHLVHKTKDGVLGVLGIMIEQGGPNAAAEKIWRHMPLGRAGPIAHRDVIVNAAELLPGDSRYYRFMGSLTTPPCTEGVNWHVLQEPIYFSQKQIEEFRRVFSMNARPVQPLNSRMVVSE